MRWAGLIGVGVLVVALAAWVVIRARQIHNDTALLNQAQSLFGRLPDSMPGAEHDTPQRIDLGRQLFFERGLSVNGTQSCNDCHALTSGNAGIDGLAVSRGALGHTGTRNAPTVLNAGLHIAQFWDGRAKHLAEQAKGPPLNVVEMAMPDEPSIESRLRDLGYAEPFTAAFPHSQTPLTFDNAAEALAAFQRTLITRSRFDAFLAGDTTALDSAERQGLETFIALGCTTCHSGPLLGGTLFQKMGLHHPYANSADLGRYWVTGQDADKYVFKVPTLRNVTRTAPYFHDGAVPSLDEAIRQMAHLQINRTLTQSQIDAIMRFLAATAGTVEVQAPPNTRTVSPPRRSRWSRGVNGAAPARARPWRHDVRECTSRRTRSDS